MIGTEPLIERDLGCAVVALKIPMMKLVEEIPGPCGICFASLQFFEPRVGQHRTDLLEIGMKQQMQRMRGYDQMDEVGGEIEKVLIPVVRYPRPRPDIDVAMMHSMNVLVEFRVMLQPVHPVEMQP